MSQAAEHLADKQGTARRGKESGSPEAKAEDARFNEMVSSISHIKWLIGGITALLLMLMVFLTLHSIKM